MKKLVLAVFFFCSINLTVSAQFLYSLGIAGGISYGKMVWNPEQYATQEKYILRLNGAALAEFSQNKVFKWRAEIMYNELGTKELVETSTYKNLTNYISLNNYLVIRHEFYSFIPYFLIGPRIAYLSSSSAGVYGNVIDGFNTIHITAAAGIGAQLITFGRFKPFIELFYNRDLMPSYSGEVSSQNVPPTAPPKTTIYQHDYELRIGIKYVFKRNNNLCPPVDNSADEGSRPK